MRESMRKSMYHDIFFALALIFLIICVLTNSFLVFKGMQSAVKICLETMIPSLYAMMILSELFISCGFHNLLGKMFKAPAKYLFKSSGQVLAIFLLSQIAGYPVGTRMMISIKDKMNLSKKQISLLSGVCFGGGPAFIFSLFAHKKGDAFAVFLACLLSNFIIFIFISRLIKADYDNTSNISITSKSFTASLTDAAVQSGTAMLKICAMIIMFGGLLGLRELPFINNTNTQQYSEIILGIFEISHITELFPYSRETLPYIGALLSFGGVCVLMQLSSIAKNSINIGYVFLTRIAAAGLTWILLFIREIFVTEKQVETAAAIIAHDNLNVVSFSPLPSLLLLIMTFMLLRSAEKK